MVPCILIILSGCATFLRTIITRQYFIFTVSLHFESNLESSALCECALRQIISINNFSTSNPELSIVIILSFCTSLYASYNLDTAVRHILWISSPINLCISIYHIDCFILIAEEVLSEPSFLFRNHCETSQTNNVPVTSISKVLDTILQSTISHLSF